MIESGLVGELYHRDPDSPPLKFSEQYFQDKYMNYLGFEARMEGSSQVAWGNVLVDMETLSLPGFYRSPEVSKRSLINVLSPVPTGSWISGEVIQSRVFLGQELLFEYLDGENKAVNTCHRFTVSEGHLDGAPNYEKTMQHEWFDQYGLAKRQTVNQDGRVETWMRRGVNLPMPVYHICHSQDSGEVENSNVSYADFLIAARSCHFTELTFGRLVGKTFTNYTDEGNYTYSLSNTTDGEWYIGSYHEREINEPDYDDAIFWKLSDDGILIIDNGGDVEYFALVSEQNGKMSLLAYYQWIESGDVYYTEIIGQEYQDSMTPL